MYYEKKCKICGKIFHTKRYLNQFCSQSCYFKSKRQERNLEKVKRIKEQNPELSPLLVDGYVRYKHKCSFCGNYLYNYYKIAVRASSRVIGGNMPAIALAMELFPDPGGPTISTLCASLRSRKSLIFKQYRFLRRILPGRHPSG